MLNFPDTPVAGTVFGAWRYDGVKWGAVSGVSGGGSAGDITAVLAGTGLSGGGTEGDVSLALAVPVTVTRGGTGATDAATARTNLGAAPVDQTVALTGDASGSGAQNTSIATTLATVNANVGTFQGLTVNAKGLVTAAANQSYLQSPVNLTSQVTGTLPVANGGSGAASLAAGPWVTRSGDTMTGDLTIDRSAGGASPTLVIKKAANFSAQIYGTTGGTIRWGLALGDQASETGAQAGSNLVVSRYNDAGTLIDSPLMINRASGDITTLTHWFSRSGASTYIGRATDGSASHALHGSPGVGTGQVLLINSIAGWNPVNDAVTYSQNGTRRAGWAGGGVSFGSGAFVDIASFAAQKSDIREIADPAALVMRLRPVAYHHDVLDIDDHGFLIDDLITDYPETVQRDATGQPEGYHATTIIAALTAALQEALRRIEALEGK